MGGVQTSKRRWKCGNSIYNLVDLHLCWSGTSLLLPVEQRGKNLDNDRWHRTGDWLLFCPLLSRFRHISLVSFSHLHAPGNTICTHVPPAPPTRTRLATLRGGGRTRAPNKPHPLNKVSTVKGRRWLLGTQHWMRFVLGVWLSSRRSMAVG